MTRKKLFGKLLKLNTNMRVKLLTHTDMDGEVPVLLFKIFFKDVTVQHCSNGTMDYDIKNAVLSPTADDYDAIVVTDISCREESAEMIDQHTNANKLIVLDHHATADYLNKYEWACVHSEIISDSYRAAFFSKSDNAHSSATSLLYNYFGYLGLLDNLPDEKRAFLDKLVHYVASYDTWDWSNVFDRKFPVMAQLNQLHLTYGDDIFEESFMRKYESGGELLDATDDVVLRAHETRLKHHIESVEKSIRTGTWVIDGKHYSIAYINNNDFLNEVADYVSHQVCPDVDMVVTSYGTGLSVRTTKSDINVGMIVAKFGGGGHPGAGGYKIDFDSIISGVERSTGTQMFFDGKEVM